MKAVDPANARLIAAVRHQNSIVVVYRRAVPYRHSASSDSARPSKLSGEPTVLKVRVQGRCSRWTPRPPVRFACNYACLPKLMITDGFVTSDKWLEVFFSPSPVRRPPVRFSVRENTRSYITNHKRSAMSAGRILLKNPDVTFANYIIGLMNSGVITPSFDLTNDNDHVALLLIKSEWKTRESVGLISLMFWRRQRFTWNRVVIDEH